jgi:hypothetical protein
VAECAVASIKRMAAVRAVKEDATWRVECICGELWKLGVEPRKSSVQRPMAGFRKLPAWRQPWAALLRSSASKFWACDSLQTYDLFFRTLFVIAELGLRRIVNSNVTRSPIDELTPRQLHEAIHFGECPEFFTRDSDDRCVPCLEGAAYEIKVPGKPYRAPRANAAQLHTRLSFPRGLASHAVCERSLDFSEWSVSITW